MKIVTFNLRCWWGDGDGINNFPYRAGMISEKIREEQPDVIGFQEVVGRQLDFLERLLPEYTLVGQFRDADFRGEGLFAAVKKSSVQILAFNTFWLSPTPYVPGSRFREQSDCPRICNVLRLRHRESGIVFRVFNHHLDHVGDEARIKGMQCILDELTRLNQIAAFPAVILGDFNALPDSEPVALCRAYEAYPLTDVTGEIGHTFHGYGMEEKAKIDYIFMTRELASGVTAAGIWDDQQHGVYLSDHYPVWAEVRTEK